MVTGIEIVGETEVHGLGLVGVVPRPLRSLATQETAFARKSGTWMNCQNLRRTFTLSIRMSSV